MAVYEFKSWLIFAIVAGIIISAVYGLSDCRGFLWKESDEFVESQKEVSVVDMALERTMPA